MKHLRHYNKLLLSYIVVLVIPLTIIISAFLHRWLVLNKEHMDREYVDDMRKVKEITDLQLNQLNAIALNIYSDHSFNLTKASPLETLELIQTQLSIYKASNAFVDEIIFFNKKDQILYTPDYVLPINRFLEYYTYDSWQYSDFYNIMNNNDKNIIRPSEKIMFHNDRDKKCITFVYPYNDVNDRAGTLLFIVDEEKLFNYIDDKGKYSNFFIINKQNQVIASMKDRDYLQDYELFNIISHINNNAGRVIKLFGKNYNIHFTKSKYHEWNLAYLNRYDELMKPNYYDYILNLVIAVIALMGFGVVLIYIWGRPYRNLLVFSKKASGVHVNSYKDVQQIIESKIQDNQGLEKQLEDSKDLKKESMVLQLLKGDKENLDFLEDNIVSEWNTKMYSVAIIKINESSGHIKATLYNTLPKGLKGFILEKIELWEYILVHGVDRKTDQKKYLENYKQRIEKYMDVEVVMGVGECYRKITNLAHSYKEACYGLSCIKLVHEPIVYANDTINTSKILHAGSVDLCKEIVNSILEGDKHNTQKVLMKLKVLMMDVEIPLLTKKYLFLEGLRYMGDVAEDRRIDIDDIDNITVSSFQVPDKMFLVLEKLAFRLCEKINDGIEKEKLILNMKDYILSHVSDIDFSIGQMAEDFGVSFSYLSRYFGEHLGETPNEYLQYCRMQEAKKLLKTTKMNLQDICTHVGYSNVSSFIRCFKKYESMTPGQYRNNAN